MKLIIAEKPSVAAAYAAALGVQDRKDGYFEGNSLIVSWCIGHLVSLAEAGAYAERYKKWNYDDLPILPEEWQYTVSSGKEKQFAILKSLMERGDVTELVNGCDAGREGELIFRLAVEMAGCHKPVSRLWISSMEDSAIREGFENLMPGSHYEALYHSALCRQKADWLIGINATRLFSVLYHKTLNVGRVQTPTLAMLAERDGKIMLFQKEKYYHVRLGLPGLEAVSERITEETKAISIQAACRNGQAVCVSSDKEKKTVKPPELFDLTTLQREANRIYGFTAKQTLDYAQSLYPEEYRVMVSHETGLSYEEQKEMDGIMLDEATSLAFDMDVLFRAAEPGYASAYPEEHEKKEEIADQLINGDYAELKARLSQTAESQGEYSQAAAELLERMGSFDEEFIGKEERMLTASMELAADIDYFFREFDLEYPAVFPDETVQQIALHEHLYKGDTSAIKTGLLNMGREKDLAEETAPLVGKLDEYEKEYGINTYMVYQLKAGEAYHEYRFEGYDRLASAGLSVDRANYEAVYAAPLTPGETLESIYTDLNLHRPDNFHGHSLSVSDVVILQEYGKETAHYCDRFGYKEVPEFLEPENHLKNAEMAVEDDYGMIDGIINNGQKNEGKEEHAEKPSVMERLSQAKKECAERKPPEPGKLGKEGPEL